jgi:hypothetical protein
MPFRLMIVDGPDVGKYFILPEAGLVTLGNSQKHCDICLHDFRLNRIHCEVTVRGDEVVVIDRSGSAEGVLHNHERIDNSQVHLGDTLRLGETVLRLELSDAPVPVFTRRMLEELDKLPILDPEELDRLGGRLISKYYLQSVIGRGLIGTVFNSVDVVTGKRYALKVLSPEFPAKDAELPPFAALMKQRLLLRHPNLVNLHGVGRTGGFVWLACDRVFGETFVLTREEAPIPRKIHWKRVAKIGIEICKAIDFLRQNHFVHGRISPWNILSNIVEIKLDDLFVTQGLWGTKLAERAQKHSDIRVLPYLAPEQFDESAGTDDLTDLYGLGATLYSFLTSRAPFQADSETKFRSAIRKRIPERPTVYQRDMPTDLEALVLRMMAKRREDRPASPNSVIQELENLLENHQSSTSFSEPAPSLGQ